MNGFTGSLPRGGGQTRRIFLMGAGSGLAALLLPGLTTKARAAATDNATVARYYSRPDLLPPVISVATAAPTVAESDSISVTSLSYCCSVSKERTRAPLRLVAGR